VSQQKGQTAFFNRASRARAPIRRKIDLALLRLLRAGDTSALIPEQVEMVCREETMLNITERLEELLDESRALVETITDILLAKTFRGELMQLRVERTPVQERVALHFLAVPA
jgi:hypothetical protein